MKYNSYHGKSTTNVKNNVTIQKGILRRPFHIGWSRDRC